MAMVFCAQGARRSSRGTFRRGSCSRRSTTAASAISRPRSRPTGKSSRSRATTARIPTAPPPARRSTCSCTAPPPFRSACRLPSKLAARTPALRCCRPRAARREPRISPGILGGRPQTAAGALAARARGATSVDPPCAVATRPCARLRRRARRGSRRPRRGSRPRSRGGCRRPAGAGARSSTASASPGRPVPPPACRPLTSSASSRDPRRSARRRGRRLAASTNPRGARSADRTELFDVPAQYQIQRARSRREGAPVADRLPRRLNDGARGQDQSGDREQLAQRSETPTRTKRSRAFLDPRRAARIHCCSRHDDRRDHPRALRLRPLPRKTPRSPGRPAHGAARAGGRARGAPPRPRRRRDRRRADRRRCVREAGGEADPDVAGRGERHRPAGRGRARPARRRLRQRAGRRAADVRPRTSTARSRRCSRARAARSRRSPIAARRRRGRRTRTPSRSPSPRDGRALYFSRSPIPYSRQGDAGLPQAPRPLRLPRGDARGGRGAAALAARARRVARAAAVARGRIYDLGRRGRGGLHRRRHAGGSRAEASKQAA